MVSRLPVIESVNALVAFLFAASAPVAIILSAGMRGGLEETDLASWIFAAFVINGVLTILMSVIFRQPLAFSGQFLVLCLSGLRCHPSVSRRSSVPIF